MSERYEIEGIAYRDQHVPILVVLRMDLCLLVPVLIVAVGEVVEKVLVSERQRDHVPASFEVLVDGFS